MNEFEKGWVFTNKLVKLFPQIVLHGHDQFPKLASIHEVVQKLGNQIQDSDSHLAEKTPRKETATLFKSQRGEVLKVSPVNKLVKSWFRQIHLKGNYGSDNLQKTWGYQQRVTFGVSLPKLMVCFNHSTQKQTLGYLCIQPDEIREIYQNVI